MKNGRDFAGQNDPRCNLNSSRRTSADFARQMTIAEFGWHFARALDYADFLDRPPGQFPTPTPVPAPEVGLP